MSRYREMERLLHDLRDSPVLLKTVWIPAIDRVLALPKSEGEMAILEGDELLDRATETITETD